MSFVRINGDLVYLYCVFMYYYVIAIKLCLGDFFKVDVMGLICTFIGDHIH